MLIDVSITGGIVSDCRGPVDLNHDGLRRHLVVHTQSPAVLWICGQQVQRQTINPNQFARLRGTGKTQFWKGARVAAGYSLGVAVTMTHVCGVVVNHSRARLAIWSEAGNPRKRELA